MRYRTTLESNWRLVSAILIASVAVLANAQSLPPDRANIPLPSKDAPAVRLRHAESPASQSRTEALAAMIAGKSAEEAAAILSGGLTSARGSGKQRVELAWAEIAVGEALRSSGKADSAMKLFQSAELLLENAAFSEDETGDHAQALLALAHIRATYLQKFLEADDALRAAAELQPDDDVIKAAMARLDGRYGSAINALRKQARGGGK